MAMHPTIRRGASATTLRGRGALAADVQRVLRNTYALLAMTLLWSALVAATSMAMRWPHPGVLLTLAGFFGLFFLVSHLRNSAMALPAVFALTGFMGYTLGPILAAYAAVPGGSGTIMLALGATGATFLALSAYALVSRRDFGFMGGFLFAGMVVAILAGLAAIFFSIPTLALVVAAMVAVLASGLILFETSRIVNGGETNYVMATVGLYVSIYNLFTSLLALMGMGGSSE